MIGPTTGATTRPPRSPGDRGGVRLVGAHVLRGALHGALQPLAGGLLRLVDEVEQHLTAGAVVDVGPAGREVDVPQLVLDVAGEFQVVGQQNDLLVQFADAGAGLAHRLLLGVGEVMQPSALAAIGVDPLMSETFCSRSDTESGQEGIHDSLR